MLNLILSYIIGGNNCKSMITLFLSEINLSNHYVYLTTYSKRHNKFLLLVPAKAIYGSFCRTENEIFNVVNYNKMTISYKRTAVCQISRMSRNTSVVRMQVR